MVRSTVRRSRRIRQCSRCCGLIDRGEQYLESVASPDHDDLGNRGWWRLPECQTCAATFGRWPDNLLRPVNTDSSVLP